MDDLEVDDREVAGERVTAGVLWLDKHRPGWRSRIDLDTLDLTDLRLCVMGQVDGSYLNVVYELPSLSERAALGFTVTIEEGEPTLEVLQDAWIEELSPVCPNPRETP